MLVERVVLPPTIPDVLAAPGLRFGELKNDGAARVPCDFQHLFARLTNRTLRELIARRIPGYTVRQMDYDVWRLPAKA